MRRDDRELRKNRAREITWKNEISQILRKQRWDKKNGRRGGYPRDKDASLFVRSLEYRAQLHAGVLVVPQHEFQVAVAEAKGDVIAVGGESAAVVLEDHALGFALEQHSVVVVRVGSSNGLRRQANAHVLETGKQGMKHKHNGGNNGTQHSLAGIFAV